jgi:hypothetical protein
METAMVVMGSYRLRPDRLSVSSRLAKLTKSQRLMTLWRLSLCETLLNRLTQDLEHVAAELRQFIQKENPVVRQRHLTRHGHLAAADQPRIGDGAVGSVT